jgi:class 3 adenylate cyclase
VPGVSTPRRSSRSWRPGYHRLVDGGRIIVTEQVATASGLPDALLHVHGPFELKNIAEPVEVVEVLWQEGQAPQEL